MALTDIAFRVTQRGLESMTSIVVTHLSKRFIEWYTKDNSKKSDLFTVLPTSISQHIIMYLDPKFVVALSRVSKWLHWIVENNGLRTWFTQRGYRDIVKLIPYNFDMHKYNTWELFKTNKVKCEHCKEWIQVRWNRDEFQNLIPLSKIAHLCESCLQYKWKLHCKIDDPEMKAPRRKLAQLVLEYNDENWKEKNWDLLAIEYPVKGRNNNNARKTVDINNIIKTQDKMDVVERVSDKNTIKMPFKKRKFADNSEIVVERVSDENTIKMPLKKRKFADDIEIVVERVSDKNTIKMPFKKRVCRQYRDGGPLKL